MNIEDLACYDSVVSLLTEEISVNERIYECLQGILVSIERINEKKTVGLHLVVTDKAVSIDVYTNKDNPPIRSYKLER